MHLATMLELAAERYPEAEAIVSGPARYTYAQWHERIERTAAGLAGLGVRPGDGVALITRNCEPMVTVYFALHKLGATAVPLNFRWSAGEMAYALRDSEARGVLDDETTAARAAEALAQAPRCTIRVTAAPGGEGRGVPFETLAAAPGRPPVTPRREDDVNIILYTSGTTGRPKGVPRTHRNDYAATVAMIIEHGLSRFERTLGVMPLYHTMGIHSLLSMVFLNGAFIVQSQFAADEVLRLIAQERISSLYLVPTIFHELVRRSSEIDVDLSCVRKLAFAGSPMTSTLVRALFERFDPEIFVNHYGSTELYIHTTNARLDQSPTSAGCGAFHTRVRVVAANPDRRIGPDEVVPRGEVGEIIVDARSAEAFGGYHNRPDATERALQEGWYFTGDTGYLDERGEVHVTGRVDDMIITGGENVHPVEVEDALAAHPGVLDVAVVGLPDEKWGQIVAAFVVAQGPVTAEDLDRVCLESKTLASFKRPRRYLFVRAIPKTASGKILRRELREGRYEPIAPAPPR